MSQLKTHNLNIHLYKFNELLDLFGLTYNISGSDIKLAKRKVLMLHPDKSKLSPEYFLFYKKAYDIINTFYENQNKQNATISNENAKYEPINQNDLNKSTNNKISSIVNDMSKTDFQTKFNKLFDDNMSNKPDITKNQWFTEQEPTYNIDDNITSNNMGQIFEKVKKTQSGLVNYKGVEHLYINSQSGTNIYEDMNKDEYISCDPFSKLKFDDLRKVHKDQTVFSVSENDIHNVTKYTSADHLMRERGRQQLTPFEKEESEKILSMQNKQYREQIMQKEYDDKLKTMQYADKNKVVMSNFLRLN
jgi:hypothetical protein